MSIEDLTRQGPKAWCISGGGKKGFDAGFSWAPSDRCYVQTEWSGLIRLTYYITYEIYDSGDYTLHSLTLYQVGSQALI
jgi:hypothetical protein